MSRRKLQFILRCYQTVSSHFFFYIPVFIFSSLHLSSFILLPISLFHYLPIYCDIICTRYLYFDLSTFALDGNYLSLETGGRKHLISIIMMLFPKLLSTAVLAQINDNHYIFTFFCIRYLDQIRDDCCLVG